MMHRCDNRACCNPSHLLAGTRSENNKDAARKGRMAKGDKNGARNQREKLKRGEAQHLAKLTAESVREMRSAYACVGATYANIANLFGVSLSCAHDAINGITWAHVV